MSEENSRIAIKLGFTQSSSLSKKDPQNKPVPFSKGSKPPRTFDHGFDDYDDDDENESQHQMITTLGDDGAETEHFSRIQRLQKNTLESSQWRSQTTREQKIKNTLVEASSTTLDDEDSKHLQSGLSMSKRNNSIAEPSSTTANRNSIPTTKKKVQGSDQDTIQLPLDAGVKNSRRLALRPMALVGDDAEAEAADESTVHDYSRVPVEGFGEVLLRQMGWDGVDRGPRVRVPKKRDFFPPRTTREKKTDEYDDEMTQRKEAKRRRMDDFEKYRAKREGRREARELDGRDEKEKEVRDSSARERNKSTSRNRERFEGRRNREGYQDRTERDHSRGWDRDRDRRDKYRKDRGSRQY